MVKLSIVIAYYKTYELTVKLLDELIKQLNDNVEVILVDDGCKEKRFDKYAKDIDIIYLKENVGGASASNVGIKKAIGKYIALIDSDDMITSDYIEVLLNAIDSHKEDVIFFDWQDMHTGKVMKRPNNYAPWKAIYKKEIMPLFRDGWKYSYDVPFQEDLSKINYTKCYLDRVLYLYNSNREGSLTLEKEKVRRQNMIKCKVIENFNLNDFDKLENIQRVNLNTHGKLFVGDTFECDKEIAEYLLGNNSLKRAVVKIVEVEPEKELKKENELLEDPYKDFEVEEKLKKRK